MELLHEFIKEKKINRNNGTSRSHIKVYLDNQNLIYESYFAFEFLRRYGRPHNCYYQHSLELNLKNGDFYITNKKTKNKRKNNFKLLHKLTDFGIYRGEARTGYWGTDYQKSIKKIENIFYDEIISNVSDKYYKEKIINPDLEIDFFYELITNYHLCKKKIRAHNHIYSTIAFEYPQKKWLVKNNNKYVQSILDSYDIKTKYYVSEINKSERPIIISGLNFLCKLFGDEHVSYLHQIPWQKFCNEDINSSYKILELKNKNEKKSLVKLINNWNDSEDRENNVYYNGLYLIYNYSGLISYLFRIFKLRSKIEQLGLTLKFNAKTPDEMERLETEWGIHLEYLKRGYKIRYEYPKDYINEIQKPFKIENRVFKPKVLVSQDEFIIEGITMKNCMSKQFISGLYNLYISLMIDDSIRINVSYNDGKLVNVYGKANTEISENDRVGVDYLTKKMNDLPKYHPNRVKYTII
jgi:hypothetical protein